MACRTFLKRWSLLSGGIFAAFTVTAQIQADIANPVRCKTIACLIEREIPTKRGLILLAKAEKRLAARERWCERSPMPRADCAR